jgi:uncharacterized membrane protein YdbT with pleckstrin-like domain
VRGHAGPGCAGGPGTSATVGADPGSEEGVVAFPEDVLTDDEQVVLHLNPHWKTLVRPVLVVFLAVVTVSAGLLVLPDGSAGTVGGDAVVAVVLGLVLGFVLRPYLVWRTTHYVFTDERVLVQEGVLSRDRRDIPLGRINDHAMRQRFAERLLGCGTLTIESAGERGQLVLVDVPRVERVQTMLYELIEASHERHSPDDDQPREVADRGGRRRPPRERVR